MTGSLRIRIGQHSDKGRKPLNQDCHGSRVPGEPQLGSKGVALALADGISTSDVAHIASEAAVKSFLEDYYCTAESWSVKTSAQRVIGAANSWLYAQTRGGRHRYEPDRGYVCTLSALVFKGTGAHLFHVGDSRIHRLRGDGLEQLTTDHRLVVSAEQSYLSRALGMAAEVDIDYRSLEVSEGDIFILTTDGVHEHLTPAFMAATLRAAGDDLDAAAAALAAEALARGSEDNLTVLIARVEALPAAAGADLQQQVEQLPPAPLLEPRTQFEGYRILRELHGSARSHIYLAEDEESGARVALKVPSVDLRNDPAYLERFMLEDWIARRIDSAHVLKPCAVTRARRSLYVATEYIEGQTLAQWMIDNPRPSLETVRDIVEQIARGLRAFHRLEMLHLDLRPQNVMIDGAGTVKLIDFGAAHVAGLAESVDAAPQILGTVQYSAPEYLLGEAGTPRADQFSLAVMTYQMLSGRLPYGASVAKARSRAAQRKLRYASVLDDTREIPAWVDAALAKALRIDPGERYDEIFEFVSDLRRPNNALLGKGPPPLIERNPLIFWQALCFVLSVALLALIGTHPALHAGKAAPAAMTGSR